MYVSQIFRKKVFWFYDFLKGKKIKLHYKMIKFLIESPNSLSSKLQNEDCLKKLLHHAINTTEFYAPYSEFTSILDFPVINKNLIRDDFESFRSSKFKKKDSVVISTSGSTGAPFSVLQDYNKRNRNLADNLYFSKKSGYEIGYRLIYLKIWSEEVTQKLFSKNWIKNIVPQSVFKLKEADIAIFLDKIKQDSHPKSFLGYSSAFDKICKYLDEKNADPINCNIQSVITMSERLREDTRDSIYKYFGVKAVSRYSNNENGVLAQEDIDMTSGFRINSASYYIEILSLKEDILVDNNERGRIVVTDLYNYAMPLIRYDTGDVGVMDVDCRGNRYLKSIEGRVLDLIYDTKGNIVPSHISYKICKYGDYKQFQLVQYGEKDYLIKLNTDKKVDEDCVITEYKGYFGSDANISIEYVDEIPLLSSGKRREVTNTYHNNRKSD
jgi:phenylacetate-CoA ligase